MTESRYYVSDSQRAEKVRQLFSTIARRYDLMNDVMSFGLHRFWKRRVADWSGLVKGQRALDVCCGTGDIAATLAGKGAAAVGLDFAAPMLAIAQKRYGTTVDWIRGDALHLPFPDGNFDAVTLGFGLRNLADFEAGLRESLRVTRPGGRVLVLDFGIPENKVWRAIYFLWLRLAVPLLGWFFAGDRDAYRYILASLENYPAQSGVRELMQKIGCENPRVINFLGGVSSIHIGERVR